MERNRIINKKGFNCENGNASNFISGSNNLTFNATYIDIVRLEIKSIIYQLAEEYKSNVGGGPVSCVDSPVVGGSNVGGPISCVGGTVLGATNVGSPVSCVDSPVAGVSNVGGPVPCVGDTMVGVTNVGSLVSCVYSPVAGRSNVGGPVPGVVDRIAVGLGSPVAKKQTRSFRIS